MTITEAERARLQAVLQEVEWAVECMGGLLCPICGADSERGHASGCEIDRALKALEQLGRRHEELHDVVETIVYSVIQQHVGVPINDDTRNSITYLVEMDLRTAGFIK